MAVSLLWALPYYHIYIYIAHESNHFVNIIDSSATVFHNAACVDCTDAQCAFVNDKLERCHVKYYQSFNVLHIE